MYVDPKYSIFEFLSPKAMHLLLMTAHRLSILAFATQRVGTSSGPFQKSIYIFIFLKYLFLPQ